MLHHYAQAAKSHFSRLQIMILKRGSWKKSRASKF